MKKLIILITLLTFILTTGIVAAAPLDQASEGQEYVVQADDSLSKVAQKFYGDLSAYPTIVDATNTKAQEDSSFTVIDNPDLIEVGQKLWIPATANSVAPAAVSANAEVTLEEQNKTIILQVYNELFGQGKTEVVNELFSEDYLQHNPMVPNGPEGLIGLIEFFKTLEPAPVTSVKHIAADGDFVALHWHSSTTPNDEFSGQAGFDLFRLDNGKIVEHWDVIQAVPTESVSGNSMFSDLYQYEGEAPQLTEAQEEANKQLVLKAYDGLFNGRQLELLDQYWAGEAYLQHNPLAANGTEGLRQAFEAINPPGGQIRFHQLLADGDLVFTFSQMLPPGADPNNEFTGLAVADIFRVVDGKIVEHWDALQEVPAETASGNSMFSHLYQK